MILIKKMRYMQNLTVQEQHIVDYILRDPQVVFHHTAQEMAGLTFTSASTVVRLCKKLGARGYPDFQLKLALDDEIRQLSSSRPAAKQPFGSLTDQMEWIPAIYDEALIETRRRCDLAVLEPVCTWVQEAGRIDIYGSESNYYTAQQACARWNEVGRSAIAHNSANHHYLSNPHLDASTLSFIISHTGRNPAMLEIARALKEKGRRTVALTGGTDTPLARLCDYTLLTYAAHTGPASKLFSSMSTQYLFDVLLVSTWPAS